MPTAARNRAWYRLHASTWAVSLLVVALLVLLVVPAAFARGSLFYGQAVYQHGWPWTFLEDGKYHEDGTEQKVPWLQSGAWQFQGDVAWSVLAADVACAVAIVAVIAVAWEWRRRRHTRLWHLTVGELLLATLAVGCGMAWWRTNAIEAARQLTVADALIDDYSIPFAHSAPVGFDYRGPIWLYRLTGQRPAWLQRVTGIGLSAMATRERPHGDVVESIGTLSQIESLNLGTLSQADGELAPLRKCSRLSRLTIADCAIEERNGAVLGQLPALFDLTLDGCRVSVEGLAHLSHQRTIEELSFHSTSLTEDGIAQLAQMRSVVRLTLDDVGLTDAALANLSGMTGLTGLSLTDNPLTDAGLRHLHGLENLEVLDLRRTGVTEAACRELSQVLPRCSILRPLDEH